MFNIQTDTAIRHVFIPRSERQLFLLLMNEFESTTSAQLCGLSYLSFVLPRVRRLLGLRVGVRLLHADQLQLEKGHLIHQIQLLSFQRGPAPQLLGESHTHS